MEKQSTHFYPRLIHLGETSIGTLLLFSYLQKSDRSSYPLAHGLIYTLHIGAMENKVTPEKAALIEEIQRRITYLLSTDDYTAEEKKAIARRFFQALEGEE